LLHALLGTESPHGGGLMRDAGMVAGKMRCAGGFGEHTLFL
jgi:hypothetical protein